MDHVDSSKRSSLGDGADMEDREKDWSAFGWDDSYSVGVSLIDDRHKTLFKMIHEINEIANWKFDSEKEAYERMITVFDGLIEYAGFHFDEEEGVMKEQGYTGEAFKKHLVIHDNFIQQILRYRCNVELGLSDETRDLGTMLNEWLVNHIKKTDDQLGKYLNSVGYF